MIPELTTEFVTTALKWMMDRTETIKAAGGLSMLRVVDDGVPIPEGWWFDPYSNYYVPPNLHLDTPRGLN